MVFVYEILRGIFLESRGHLMKNCDCQKFLHNVFFKNLLKIWIHLFWLNMCRYSDTLTAAQDWNNPNRKGETCYLSNDFMIAMFLHTFQFHFLNAPWSIRKIFCTSRLSAWLVRLWHLLYDLHSISALMGL